MVIRYNIDDEYVCPRCNLNLYYDEFEEEYYCPRCSYIVDARHNLLQASISQNEHNSYSQFLGSVIIKNYKNNEEYIKRLYEGDKYKITLIELMEEHINPILIHIGLTEWRRKIIDMVLERVRDVHKLRYIDEKTGKAYLNNNDDLPYAVYFVILYIIFTNKLEYKVRSAIRNNLNIQEKGSRLEDIILNLVLTEFPLRTKKKGIKTDIPYFLIPVLLKKARRLGAKKAYEIVYKLKEKMKMKKEEKEKEELCHLHDYFDVKNAVVLDKEYIMLYRFGIIFTYPSDPFEESMIFFNYSLIRKLVNIQLVYIQVL
jgi:hypothetical protein